MCMQEGSVNRLWSLTPCFALISVAYRNCCACPTLPSSSTYTRSSMPAVHAVSQDILSNFPCLRVCVNSACFFFSHDREVFLTHYWLNIAQRSIALASHSRGCLVNVCFYQLVRLEGYVCLSMCGCTYEHLLQCNEVRSDQLEAEWHGFSCLFMLVSRCTS